MEIIVRYNSKMYPIEIPDDASVSMLMQKIAETTQLPISNQKIIFKGTTLSNPDALLTSYKITNKSKLLLIGSVEALQPANPPQPMRPFIEFFLRSPPRVLRDEYLTAQPHSTIIKKGPPPNAIEGGNFQMDILPKEPLHVLDNCGDEATLSFRGEDIVIDSENNHHRLFYAEIIGYGIQVIPGYDRKYVAIGVLISHQKIWVYFVPMQYVYLIETILKQRRG